MHLQVHAVILEWTGTKFKERTTKTHKVLNGLHTKLICHGFPKPIRSILVGEKDNQINLLMTNKEDDKCH